MIIWTILLFMWASNTNAGDTKLSPARVAELEETKTIVQNAVDNLVKLVKNNPIDREKFCGKGSLTRTTIRSYSGTNCTSTVAGSLAYLACKGFGDFNKSECHKTAVRKALTAKLSIPEENGDEQAKKVLVYMLQVSPLVDMLCPIIKAILPEKNQSCLQNMGLIKRYNIHHLKGDAYFDKHSELEKFYKF